MTWGAAMKAAAECRQDPYLLTPQLDQNQIQQLTTSLDNDMRGSDESSCRQDDSEGGECEQAEAVKHLQVIDQSKINPKM